MSTYNKSTGRKIGLFLSVLLCLNACEKSFLDQAPQTTRSEVNFYKSSSDFNNALIGVYANLKHVGLYANGSGALHVMTEIVSDNTENGATRQAVNQGIFEINDFLTLISTDRVRDCWIGLYTGIGRTNSILDRLPSASIAQADKDKYEAEAKFMRAMFYFHLVRLYGDVPIITQEITSPYGANEITRSPINQVYDLIVADLKTAESKLPLSIPAAQAGRATQGAAKVLLGKVYLTLKQYDNASAKLKEVIDAKTYDLLSKYGDVFAHTTSFTANKELIFAVQYLGGQIGQGSNMWSEWAPFNAGTALLGSGGGAGNGFNKPTTDMANAYEAGDLRKDASMLTSYKSLSGQEVKEAYVVKFRQQGALAGDSDVDFPILRYADVLLMYAEALNEQGKTAEALPFLNQIRKRAGLADKTGLNQADFRLAIEQERRVEFAFEGHRWYDLIRTNRQQIVLSAKGLAIKEFHKLFPIPQREVDLNANLTQNPGY